MTSARVRAAMTGEVGHFEIPADKPDRARKFYAATFGWMIYDLVGMVYSLVSRGPVDELGMPKEPGSIGGGIGPRGKNLQHPVVTIIVDEIDDALEKIEKNGGKVTQKKTPVGYGSMGWTAYFKDSEGNTIGLYQWPPSARQ